MSSAQRAGQRHPHFFLVALFLSLTVPAFSETHQPDRNVVGASAGSGASSAQRPEADSPSPKQQAQEEEKTRQAALKSRLDELQQPNAKTPTAQELETLAKDLDDEILKATTERDALAADDSKEQEHYAQVERVGELYRQKEALERRRAQLLDKDSGKNAAGGQKPTPDRKTIFSQNGNSIDNRQLRAGKVYQGPDGDRYKVVRTSRTQSIGEWKNNRSGVDSATLINLRTGRTVAVDGRGEIAKQYQQSGGGRLTGIKGRADGGWSIRGSGAQRLKSSLRTPISSVDTPQPTTNPSPQIDGSVSPPTTTAIDGRQTKFTDDKEGRELANRAVARLRAGTDFSELSRAEKNAVARYYEPTVYGHGGAVGWQRAAELNSNVAVDGRCPAGSCYGTTKTNAAIRDATFQPGQVKSVDEIARQIKRNASELPEFVRDKRNPSIVRSFRDDTEAQRQVSGQLQYLSKPKDDKGNVIRSTFTEKDVAEAKKNYLNSPEAVAASPGFMNVFRKEGSHFVKTQTIDGQVYVDDPNNLKRGTDAKGKSIREWTPVTFTRTEDGYRMSWRLLGPKGWYDVTYDGARSRK